MAAIRGRNVAGPAPRSEPNPFYFSFTSGTNRPQPKVAVNYMKLRAFSESPIPRRAIDYLKHQVAAQHWDIVPEDGTAPNGRQKREIAIVKAILKAPNSHLSYRDLIEMIVDDMLTIGHAAVEKRLWPTNPDKPLVLYPMDAASVHLYTDWDGSPSKPRYAQIDRYGKTIDFRDDQLMYLVYNPRTNTPWGLSPLEVAAQTIDYLLNTQAYAARASSNATPRKLIDLGSNVEPDQVKEIRKWWRDEVEGRGHQPIIGSGDAKTLELGAASDEALFLRWQQMLINQIANAFGLDAQKFSAILATKSNGDVMDDASDEGAVRPLAATIAEAINREIIRALGFKDIEFRFRWTANLKDRKSLAAIHQIYLTQEAMTIDEVRQEIGYPPLPDGKGQYTLAEYRAMFSAMNTNGTSLPGGLVNDEAKRGLANVPMPENPKQTQGQNQTPALKEPQNQNAKDPMKIA